MEGVNKKYYIELEVLTPLNIGAGAEKDWVKGADFVVKDQILYKLNLRKMAKAGFDLGPLSSYFAKKDVLALLRLIGNRLAEVSDFSMQIPVDSDNDIKSFVKNQLSGKPVLAGSSIKGAIRSVLFDYLRDKEQKEQDVFGSSTKGDEFMRFVKFSDIEFDQTALVNTKIFNLRKQEGVWLGGWKHAQNSTNSRFDQRGFNTLYEVLTPNQKSFGYLMLSEKMFENFDFTSFYNNEKKRAEKLNDIFKKKIVFNSIDSLSGTIGEKSEIVRHISKLFKIINDHTKEYLQKEKAFFEKYPAENLDKIIGNIMTLLQKIPTDNSFCIFKMSAGSGFHSITGDWQFDDYSINGLDASRRVSRGLFNGRKSAKSRKIAVYDDAFSLMGFVKMSVLAEEQVKEYIAQKEEKRQQKERILYEAKQERLDVQRRLEEERKKISDYHKTIDTANQLFDNGELENALKEFQRAVEIFPKGTKHADKIQKIKSILEHRAIIKKVNELELEANTLFDHQEYKQALEKYEQAQDYNVKIFYEQIKKCKKKIELLNGSIEDFVKTSSIPACANNLKKWIDVHGELTEEQCGRIAELMEIQILKLNKSKQREWKEWKKWKPIIDVLGESRAKKIYDKIFS